MKSPFKIVSLVLLVCICLTLTGCEATMTKAHEFDLWIQKNLW